MLVTFNMPRSPMRFLSWDLCVDETLASLANLYSAFSEEVAVGASDGNFLGKLDVEAVREMVDFFLQLLFNLREWVRHGYWLFSVSSLKKVWGSPGDHDWFPGPRVRKHYRGGCEWSYRGRTEIPSLGPFLHGYCSDFREVANRPSVAGKV